MPAESASAILTNELNRLEAKKTSIDNAHATQKRLMILNDSYRKRYSKYTQMIALFVFCVISVLALNAMAKAMPFIPSVIFTAATFIVVVYCVFYIISLYFEIQSRSRLNYDELNLPPTVDTSNNAVSFGVDTKDKTGELNLGRIYDILQSNGVSACVAGDCCPEGYTYQSNTNNCVATPTTTPFTLMSDVPEMSRGSSNVFATELGTPISSSVATTGERYVEQRFMYKKE
jgi:hypothetical protein